MSIEKSLQEQNDRLIEQFRERYPEHDTYKPRFRTLRWIFKDMEANPGKYQSAIQDMNEIFKIAQIEPPQGVFFNLVVDSDNRFNFVLRRTEDPDEFIDQPLQPDRSLWMKINKNARYIKNKKKTNRFK